MDSAIEKGRNVEEAVNKALKKLNTTIEHVEIEVVEEAEKRILGMIVKPAVVKVTKKQVEADSHNAAHPNESTSGKAWVKNGIIVFEASEHENPSIVPCEGIIVYKNGEIVHGETTLKKGDRIHTETKKISEDGVFQLTMDKQKLTATVKIIPGYVEEMKLIDHLPEKRLILKAEKVRRSQSSLTNHDIVQAIKEKGIVFGIDTAAIAKACQMEQIGEVKIAEGIAAEKGNDGYVEFFIDVEAHRLKPKELPDGTVDFREINQIPMVEKGETIGIIHPPTEGKAGKTVTGELIPTPPVHEVTVNGQDIEVNGEIIKATKTGAANVQIRKQTVIIEITEKLNHQGDVDIKSGNISFVGDVEIQGNVRETMTVTAKEKLLIHGSVYGAVIKAGASLVVNKNVVNSKLIVGMDNEQLFVMIKQVEQLIESFYRFRVTLEQLLTAQRHKQSIAKPDLSMIVRTLIAQKFSTLPKQVSVFIQLLNEQEMPNIELKEIANLLHGAFVTVERSLLTHEKVFVDIEARMKELKDICEMELQPFGSITVSSSQQSEIYCNGDVFLTGKGAYNTKIEARGKVHLNGFIRGGSIHAEESIHVREVGSSGGVETFLSVPAGKEIVIGHVLEDTIIQIGKKRHKFVTERNHVRAHLNEDGDIRLSYVTENV